MPTPLRYSATPFARTLTAFMWSKQPPWSAPKVAAVLGIQRGRVNNWLYHDIVPEINVILAVMAALEIPLSRLMDAYVAAGLPTPPLTEADVPPPAPEPAPSLRRPDGLGVSPCRLRGRGGVVACTT